MDADDNRLRMAIQAAQFFHRGHLDKAGQPFIGHPLRVMARLMTESEMIVGVMHDIVEDCPSVTLEFVENVEWLRSSEIAGIDAMTRRPGEAYFDYINRCAADELGRVVKLADIEDNADPSRGWAGTPLSRYRRAWPMLTSKPLPYSLEKVKEEAE